MVVPVLVAVLSIACGSATTSLVGGRKWVGPAVSVPGGGHFRTVIHYGPWQCRADFMRSCQNKCASAGLVLQGCMWLADIKMDFEGTVVQAGSRFGVTHCCCNYAELTPAQTEAQRKRWNSIRTSFRQQWAERFGAWPAESTGTPFQGHHVQDLWHGGAPTAWENVFPMPDDIHRSLFGFYNQCYANNPPWRSIGTDYPYGE